MSFFINNNNPARPGPIRNAGTGSVCEKVLIETTKVFDACMTQTTEPGFVLTVSGFNPPAPVQPLTYISADSNNQAATVTGVTIERLADRPNFANVSATISIPVVVTYRDANGVVGTAQTSVVVERNAVLFVPQPSLTPISVTALASVTSSIGNQTADNVFTVTACITVVLKVVGVVDILVPSYGYPCFPTCRELPASAVCPGVDQPIFPLST